MMCVGRVRRQRNRPLSCRDLRWKVLMYAEGTLEGPERGAVEAHLEACESCRTTAGHMRDVTIALTVLRDEPATQLDPVRLALIARREVARRRGVRGLALQVGSRMDALVGPVLDHPTETLLTSGAVMWLATLNVAEVSGLEKFVVKAALFVLDHLRLPGCAR